MAMAAECVLASAEKDVCEGRKLQTGVRDVDEVLGGGVREGGIVCVSGEGGEVCLSGRKKEMAKGAG
jgi:predicted ATP-dependent serine protease